jgi:hypothetical protein
MAFKRRSFFGFGSSIMSHTADDGDTLLQKSASEGTKVLGERTEHTRA